MSEPRIIELDPDVWMRGKKGGYLLTHHDRRQQCCIGVACTFFGLSDEVIAGNGMIEELDASEIIEPFLSLVDIDYDVEGEADDINDRLTVVYCINDDESITDDAARVRDINEELANLRASFRFVLKSQTSLGEALEPTQATAASEAK